MGVVTGTFQYANGSPVATGLYQFKLSQDAVELSVACVAPSIIRGNLDSSGNLTATFLFNDALSTAAGATTNYQLTVKDSKGGQVWDEYYYLTGTAVNLNAYPPNGGSLTFGQGSLLLQIDGTNTTNQATLNATAAGGMSISADSAGQWVFSAATSSPLLLQINGANTANQATLNATATGLSISSDSGGTWTFANTFTALSNLVIGQIGDILRYNVNANGQWNAVNAAQRTVGVFPEGGSLVTYGSTSGGSGQTGSTTNTNPSATTGWSRIYSAAASAATVTGIGVQQGTGGTTGLYGMLAFYRQSTRLAISPTTSARYWIGLGCWNTGSSRGSNGTQVLATSVYAADLPNHTTLGFRYSATTDTHWQAVSINAGTASASSTVVDTGISPDTSAHLFEMATNAAGSSVYFLIDNTVVATISSNLPDPTLAADSWGSMFWTGDNKNSATAISGTMNFMQISIK